MDLAALELKLSADFAAGYPAINKLIQGLDNITVASAKTNASLDLSSRTLAKFTALTSGTSGGMKLIADNSNKAASSIAQTTGEIEDSEQAVSDFGKRFSDAMKAAIDSANQFPTPLIEASEAAAQLNDNLSTLKGTNLLISSEGTDQVLNDAKLIKETLQSIPANITTQFQLSGNTQEALSQLSALGGEIEQLGSGGAASIAGINAALAQLRTASANATDIESIQRYDNAINLLKGDLSRIEDTVKKSGVSLSNIGAGSNSATLALQNLGRVAQDLPYGFIGISNNLNPLLESFQRLAAETKATGASITSVLLKSLTGAGGLGLALSAVTAAFSFASFGLQFWTRGIGQSKKTVDDTTKSIDAYTQALNDSYKAAGQQLAQVSELVAAAEKQGITTDHLKKALQDLQNISGTYFDNLKVENGLINGLAEAYDAYANNILKVARAKAAEQSIQNLSAELIKTTDAVSNIDKGLTNLNLTASQAAKFLSGQANVTGFDAIAKASQKINDIVEKGLPTFKDIQFLVQVTGKSEAEINRILADRFSLKTKEQQLTAQITSLSKFIADNDDKSATSTGITKSNAETVAKILAELQKELNFLDAKQLNEGLDESHEKISAIEDAIKKLININIPADSTLIQKLFGDISVLRLPDTLKALGDYVNKHFSDNIKPPYLPVTIQPTFNKEAMDDLLNRTQIEIESKKLKLNFDSSALSGNEVDILLKPLQDLKKANESLQQDFGVGLPRALRNAQREFQLAALEANSLLEANQALNDFINKTAIASFESFGAAIGEALAGGNVSGLFEGLFESIGNAIKELGDTLIATSPLIAAIKVSINSLNPALALAAGIALEALGTLIEAKAPKLAAGGIVPPGYPADSYPALLTSGEIVTPPEKLDKLLNNNIFQTLDPIVIIPDAKLKGSDIVISYNQTTRKNGRTF